MSKIDYNWRNVLPPYPDVYVTRRRNSKYLTNRYWDGQRWFEINYSKSRGGIPFKWPKSSRVRRPRPASWSSKKEYDFYLRRINQYQGEIQWGDPFTVYDDKEVLAYLVEIGILPPDWKEAFQDSMRAAARKGKE